MHQSNSITSTSSNLVYKERKIPIIWLKWIDCAEWTDEKWLRCICFLCFFFFWCFVRSFSISLRAEYKYLIVWRIAVSWISCELKCVATCLSSSLSKFVSYPKFYWSHSQAIFVRRILSYHIASLCFFSKTKHKSIRTKGAETHTHTPRETDKKMKRNNTHPELKAVWLYNDEREGERASAVNSD